MKIIDTAKELARKNNINAAIDLLEDFIKDNPNEKIGAHRYLSLLYVRKGDCNKAQSIVKNAVKNQPDNLWMKLFLGDLLFFDCSEKEKAIMIYEDIFSQFSKPSPSTMSPYRYVLKRLSNYYYDVKDFKKAKFFFEKFYSIQPSDFYVTDFLRYADILLRFNEIENAKEVLSVGIRTHPGEKSLYENALKYFPNEIFPYSEKKQQKYSGNLEIIPIKTGIIREGDDIVKIVEENTKTVRKNGDLIVLSSCVAAIAEERVIPVDTIKPGFMAKFLSSLVSQKNVPFGGAAPLANSYAMQVAIEEIGLPRIILAVKLGALGKIFGRSGVFYRIAGPQSALIDDPPAAIPPYDYVVIPGPVDSFSLAEKIKNSTGCETAIVDANDLGNAWAVGYTEKVNKKLIEEVLSTNPSGNEDQTTPILIIRGLT